MLHLLKAYHIQRVSSTVASEKNIEHQIPHFLHITLLLKNEKTNHKKHTSRDLIMYVSSLLGRMHMKHTS